MYQPKITPAARERCAAHTLQDQLAKLRELERQRIITESYERIIRGDDEKGVHKVDALGGRHPHRLVMPLDGAD